MPRLIAYIRVSRVGGRDVEHETSAPDQKRAIRALATARGFDLLDVVEDYDESGGRYDRPGFQAVLERLERGEGDGIIVNSLDRFSRRLSDALKAIERIDAAGKELVSVRESFDTSTPIGRAMMQITLVFAELQREQLRESWYLSTSNAIEEGVYIAAMAPTGYHKRDDGRLEPDPAVAGLVRKVFRDRADGATYAELGRLLTDAGVRTPRGNTRWTSNAVKWLLRNPAYLGHARQGKRVNVAAHEPIVTRQEWQLAQTPPRSRSTGETMLLTGLARCASCRYRLKGRSKTGVYQCQPSHATGTCSAPAAIQAGRLEEYVVREYAQAVAEMEPVTATPAMLTAETDEVRAQLAEDAAELETYVANESILSLGVEMFQRGLDARQQRYDATFARLAELERASGLAGLVAKPPPWDDLSVSEQRELLGSVFAAVVVYPSGSKGGRGEPVASRVRLVRHGDMPENLPGRGQRDYHIAPWPGERPRHLRVATSQDS